MKKLIIVLIAFTLSACETQQELIEANDVNFRTVCIDGLSYLTYQGSFLKNFQQIYIPADDPRNPPQPKICSS